MPDWQLAVTFVFAIVIPILGVLIPFLMHINKSNEEAHRQIGKNIDGAREEIGKVDGKVDGINNDLKELNRAVGRLEGSERNQNRTNAEP